MRNISAIPRRIMSYLFEVRAEMKKVNWLQRNEVISYTVAVVVIAFSVAVYLGLLDFFFSWLLNRFVLK